MKSDTHGEVTFPQDLSGSFRQVFQNAYIIESAYNFRVNLLFLEEGLANRSEKSRDETTVMI